MASRDRRGRIDGGLSAKQMDLLRRLNEDEDGERYMCMEEQAVYTKLEKRGFLSFGRKDTLRITREGRNMLNGASADV